MKSILLLFLIAIISCNRKKERIIKFPSGKTRIVLFDSSATSYIEFDLDSNKIHIWGDTAAVIYQLTHHKNK